MRLVFMGSPVFSVAVLAALKEAGHEIAGVWSQPPKPSGRGQKLSPTPVHKWAEENGLLVFTPQSLKGAEEQAQIAELMPEAIIVVAYGLLLPQAVLNIPKLGCLNLHASVLPRWRGAAPIHRAIQAGDRQTGVQVMAMEAGLDTGPVYATAFTPISDTDTTASLHDRLSVLGAGLIVESLPAIADGRLKPVTQSTEGVTYAHKISREEARINWALTGPQVDCAIRAFSPAPAAWCTLPDGATLKVLMSELAVGLIGNPGQVLDGQMTIACGSGAVRLLRVQSPGKPAMAANEWLRGNPLMAGSILG